MFNRVISKISGVPQTYIGSTGRSYQFEQLLQQREHFGRIWLATLVFFRQPHLRTILDISRIEMGKPSSSSKISQS
jgi:hypothetical protein